MIPPTSYFQAAHHAEMTARDLMRNLILAQGGEGTIRRLRVADALRDFTRLQFEMSALKLAMEAGEGRREEAA